MLKKILLALAVTVATLGLTAAPASAADTVSNTITKQSGVNAVAKSMMEEYDTAATGCTLHRAVKSALSYAKVGRTMPIKVATAALKAANKQGSGFCGAATVIVGTVAAMQVTFHKYDKVYVKQTTDAPPSWKIWEKVKVTRWIGPDSSHVTKFYYAV